MIATESMNSYLSQAVLPPWLKTVWVQTKLEYKIGFYSVQVFGKWGEE